MIVYLVLAQIFQDPFVANLGPCKVHSLRPTSSPKSVRVHVDPS